LAEEKVLLGESEGRNATHLHRTLLQDVQLIVSRRYREDIRSQRTGEAVLKNTSSHAEQKWC